MKTAGCIGRRLWKKKDTMCLKMPDILSQNNLRERLLMAYIIMCMKRKSQRIFE